MRQGSLGPFTAFAHIPRRRDQSKLSACEDTLQRLTAEIATKRNDCKRYQQVRSFAGTLLTKLNISNDILEYTYTQEATQWEQKIAMLQRDHQETVESLREVEGMKESREVPRNADAWAATTHHHRRLKEASWRHPRRRSSE